MAVALSSADFPSFSPTLNHDPNRSSGLGIVAGDQPSESSHRPMIGRQRFIGEFVVRSLNHLRCFLLARKRNFQDNGLANRKGSHTPQSQNPTRQFRLTSEALVFENLRRISRLERLQAQSSWRSKHNRSFRCRATAPCRLREPVPGSSVRLRRAFWRRR